MSTAEQHSETERYTRLPIASIVASKTNPRTNFDPEYISFLAGSIREKDVIQPILVRPHGTVADRFEIIAGECRFRASKEAGRTTIPTVVRNYTDEQVLELQLIENIHRKDLTAMEQARGYRRLIDSNPDKHSAKSIATRIGMSVSWVWDRLKLNDLVPAAVALLESGRIAEGHAILIARLKPEDQERVIAPDDRGGYGPRNTSGLWEDEHARLDYDDDERQSKEDPYEGVKPKSIKELDRWISDHIRFDVDHAAKAQPLEFEDVAAKVEAAEQQPGRGRKVIPITFDYRVSDDAKDPTERTYGTNSWRRADGEADSKTCDHSVLGLVVAGPSYGQALQVCIARDRCKVHFAKEIREREKSAKARESGTSTKAAKSNERAEQARLKQEADEQRKRDQWKVLYPALLKAIEGAVDDQPQVLTDAAFAWLLARYRVAKTTSRAGFLLALFTGEVLGDVRRLGHWPGHEPTMAAVAKMLGVDVKAVKASVTKPADKPADKAAPKKVAKKAAKTATTRKGAR